MSISFAIAGVSGYAGGELLRILLSHPAYLAGELRLGALCGYSSAGESAGAVLPAIPELSSHTIQEIDPDVLGEHDVVFLALPHGNSAALAKALQARSQAPLIIDCSADFRLRRRTDWEEFYGGEYAGSWPYGIPEIPGNREKLRAARSIAVPGCFPTAITLGALPAVARGLVTASLSVVAVTGVSGAGKKAKVDMLGAEIMGNVRAYSPGGTHRHTPEVIQNLQPFTSDKVTVSFTPVLAPLPRGILATVSAPLAGGVGKQAVRSAYEEFYQGEPFVHLLPEGVQPQTQCVLGSNMAHIQAHVDDCASMLVVTTAIDNLTKGTAGAAIQCMNLALGWREVAGLPRAAVAP